MSDNCRFAGMTTDERLLEVGLLDGIETAARSRDANRVIEILSKVDLGSQAQWIVETTLSNPKKYGF